MKKPLVISYTRFSSSEQALGDSERRQVEAAQRWAKERGYTLTDKFQFIDRGRSGFKGHHRSGDFGKFLSIVEAGEVPPGSILLVENIDRLSRERLGKQLRTIICDILEKGIKIVTLSPQDEFTMESVEDGGIYRLIAYMMMSYAESKKKADRISASWENKRKLARDGKVLSKNAPAWLRVKDGKFEVIPEAAETVRWIFQLKLDGFGKRSIERKLNGSPSTWVPERRSKRQRTGGWRHSYIEKIIRSRTVLGELQLFRKVDGKRVPVGDPIPDYYPEIVKPEVFNAVQKKLNSHTNSNGSGRTGKLNNVLRHLAVCGYCGGPMAFVDKGELPKGGRYLVCDAARSGDRECVPHFAKYHEVEQTVLDNCSKLRPELILPDSGEQAEEGKRLRIRIEGLNAELDAVEKEKENLAASLAMIKNPELLARCEKQFEEAQGKGKHLEEQLAIVEASLVQTEKGRDTFDRWQKGLDGLKNAIAKDADTRRRLNNHLKEFISKVEVFVRGHEDDVDRAEDFLQSMPELVRSPAFKSFRKYVSHRLRSEDGRFFRIHFRMSESHKEKIQKAFGNRPWKGLQVAPAGSLAYRIEVRGKDRASTGPELDRLSKEFFDGRKPGFVPKGTLAKVN